MTTGDNNNYQDFIIAIKENDFERALYLHTKGIDVNFRNPADNGNAALHVAAASGNFQMIALLCRIDASINHTNDQGATALHVACEHNQYKAVESLLHQGAYTDIVDWAGTTPLHLAAKNGDIKMIKLLLKYGADLIKQNAMELTAENIAHNHGKLTIANYLKAIRLRKEAFAIVPVKKSETTTYQ